jgi:hypothetical protein
VAWADWGDTEGVASQGSTRDSAPQAQPAGLWCASAQNDDPQRRIMKS